jgi:hypothetical protein
MSSNEIISRIVRLINEDFFKNELKGFMKNFSNLKQEYLIRDLLLKQLNHELPNDMKAFAEYPRGKGRVDLSILKASQPTKPFLVELKYQFNKDYKNFSDFSHVINRDFNEVKTPYGKPHLFILIVHTWNNNEKLKYFDKWQSHTRLVDCLDIYNCNDKVDWIKTLNQHWKEHADITEPLLKHEITLADPYEASYHFFLLCRKSIDIIP